MTAEELANVHRQTLEALQACVLAVDGTRAALMAIAYALSQQPSINTKQLLADASYAINHGFDEGEPIPASATEFLAQLHDAVAK